MFAIKRNQVIITALVVMIGIAGYLNYIDTKPRYSEVLLNDDGEISALISQGNAVTEILPVDNNLASLTNTEIGEAITEDDNPAISTGSDNTPEPGEAVFVNASNVSSFSVQARLEREQAMAKEKEMLTELINNPNVSAEQKAECAQAIMKIQERINMQLSAETMLEAKGFKNVYVRVDANGVDVVVDKEAISDAEMAQILDIIKRVTSMGEDKIHVSPMRK